MCIKSVLVETLIMYVCMRRLEKLVESALRVKMDVIFPLNMFDNFA